MLVTNNMQQIPFIDLFIDLLKSALHVTGNKLAHLQQHFLTAYTFKNCSWRWASLSPETCTEDLRRSIKRSINVVCCNLLVTYVVVVSIRALADITSTNSSHLTASVQPSRAAWTVLLLVNFSSYFEGLFVPGCTPSLYATLWTLRVSHAFQGSAKLTSFPVVSCSQGLRLKAPWSKPFLPCTKGILKARWQWNMKGGFETQENEG
jgi:hypothetical protein